MHTQTSMPPRHAPLDQAHGLRRLFAARRARFVALVHNPEVAHGGTVIERLVSAYGQRALNCLVVDAAPSAREPHEMALIDLKECIERLSAKVSFVAARGLPAKYVDSRGSSAGFLQALADAAPEAQVILVHAAATDLARLFTRRVVRPLLLADTGLHSLTAAYAGMKTLSQRLGLMAYDLIVAEAPEHEHVPRIAERLASCGDQFLGTTLHDWVALDPAVPPEAGVSAELLHLAMNLLSADSETQLAWAAAEPSPLHTVPGPLSDWDAI